MSENRSEEQSIIDICQKYIDAFNNANSSLMEGVFLPDAIIHGAFGGDVWVGKIADLADFCDANLPGRDSNMTADIKVLDIINVSAAVRVDVKDYHGQFFTDFFAMQKIDNNWTIVGKVFCSA